MLNARQLIRYEKHIDLNMFGEEKQINLLNSEVAIIGAGGLGCPVSLYLCASGVGKVKLIDDDVVSLSNLARQILYCYDDIGKNKVDVAKEKLNSINPDCEVESICSRINVKNALNYLKGCDLIIDASDNFNTRYALNKIAIESKIPLLSGSVVHYTGQVILFHPTQSSDNPCYSCLYPVEPKNHEVPTCLDSGVLSPITGTIGSLMASEAIKYLTGINSDLYNQLLIYNALHNRFDNVALEKKTSCCACI